MAHYCLHDRARRLVVCVDPMCGSNTVREWFLGTVDADATSGDIVLQRVGRSPASVSR